MSRALPDRRPHFVQVILWAGASWLVGVSLDPEGLAAEIFIDPCDTRVLVDEAVIHLVHSSAIVTSRFLRAGVSAAELAERLDGPAPDLMTLALRQAVAIERAHGALVRRVETWRTMRIAGETIDISAELAEARRLITVEDAARHVDCDDCPAGRGGPCHCALARP